MRLLPTRHQAVYLIWFFSFFCLFYFGTLLVIGLSTPENAYSPFVANYLDYPTLLRRFILGGAKFFVNTVGHQTRFADEYTILLITGGGVKLVYSCLGYGVMSFWAAFVLANRGSLGRKFAWLFAGWLAVYVLNVARIGLLLLAVQKKSSMPFGLDHHLLFNAAAYLAIFLLIYLYDRSARLKPQPLQRNENESIQIQERLVQSR